MKNYTVALIREMQIKTIMTYIMPFKVAIIQKEKTQKNNMCSWEFREIGTFMHCW